MCYLQCQRSVTLPRYHRQQTHTHHFVGSQGRFPSPHRHIGSPCTHHCASAPAACAAAEFEDFVVELQNRILRVS